MKPILEPNREQIATFVRTVFKHASPGGWVALRSFSDDGGESKNALFKRSVKLNGNLEILVDAAYAEALKAARSPRKAVYCPPVALFGWSDGATEDDLIEGPVLSVELDRNPKASLSALEKLLGPASLVIESGGITAEGDPGPCLLGARRAGTEDARGARAARGDRALKKQGKKTEAQKVRAARTLGELDQLKEARALAKALVGADGTNIPVVHPIRWPGSVHRKGEPKLCQIRDDRPDHEIELAEVLEKLRAVATPEQKAAASGQTSSEFDELVEALLTGENFHNSLVRLAAKVIARGFSEKDAISFLQGLMNSVLGPHDERWQTRFDEIPRSVATAIEKFGRDDNLPTIYCIGRQIPRMTNEAEAALIKAGAEIYVHGRQLAQPVIEECDAAHDRKTMVARLRPMTMSPWSRQCRRQRHG